MRPLHLPTIRTTPKPAESLKAHDGGPSAPKPAAAHADGLVGLKSRAQTGGEATAATAGPRAKLGQLAKLLRGQAGRSGAPDANPQAGANRQPDLLLSPSHDDTDRIAQLSSGHPRQKRAADRLAAQQRNADPSLATKDPGVQTIRQNLSDTIRNSSRDRLAAPLNKNELDLAAQTVAQLLGKDASRAEQAVGALVGYDLYKPASAGQPVSQPNADAFKLLRALASMPDPGGAKAASSLLSGAVQNPMLNAKQMQIFAAAADLVDPQRLATHPDQLIDHVEEQLTASGGSAQHTGLLEKCKSALLGEIVATAATSLPGTKSGDTLSELKRGGISPRLQLQEGSPVLSNLGPSPDPGTVNAAAEAMPSALQPGVFKPLPDALDTGLKDGPVSPQPLSPPAPRESDASEQRMSSATEMANAFGKRDDVPRRFRDASEATQDSADRQQRAKPVPS